MITVETIYCPRAGVNYEATVPALLEDALVEAKLGVERLLCLLVFDELYACE
jgi:hypothetical protein